MFKTKNICLKAISWTESCFYNCFWTLAYHNSWDATHYLVYIWETKSFHHENFKIHRKKLYCAVFIMRSFYYKTFNYSISTLPSLYTTYFLCLIYNHWLCENIAAWKVSNYGVFSGPYFPLFWLNTEFTE